MSPSLGLCRIYLHPEVADAYRDYVHHEEHVREQLRRHEGKPLREWQRAFLLDHRMHPTRSNTLTETVHRPEMEGWFRQRYPHANADLIERNRTLVDNLVARCAVVGFSSHPEHLEHKIAELALQEVYESFVVDYQCFEGDTATWTVVALSLGELLHEKPDARCRVINVGGGGARDRSEDSKVPGRIGQLFEGRRPKTGTPTYRGDDHFREAAMTTIQLHRLNIVSRAANGTTTVLFPSVSAIAVHLPDDFSARDFVVQHKEGQGA